MPGTMKPLALLLALLIAGCESSPDITAPTPPPTSKAGEFAREWPEAELTGKWATSIPDGCDSINRVETWGATVLFYQDGIHPYRSSVALSKRQGDSVWIQYTDPYTKIRDTFIGRETADRKRGVFLREWPYGKNETWAWYWYKID